MRYFLEFHKGLFLVHFYLKFFCVTSLRIQDRNLQKLVTEIFQVKMNLGPEIMKEVFEIVEGSHALRNELKLKSRKIHSVRYGIETASFVGARVWNRLPSDLKQCKSLELFKSKIKN